jgi:hypothetical protein
MTDTENDPNGQIQPNEFFRLMKQLRAECRDPRLATAHGVGIMWKTLNSLGYGAGLEEFDKATSGVSLP